MSKGGRGTWGNGDIHGNYPKLLNITKVVINMSQHIQPPKKSFISAQKKVPEYFDSGLTYQGEKYLARIKQKGLDKLIDFML